MFLSRKPPGPGSADRRPASRQASDPAPLLSPLSFPPPSSHRSVCCAPVAIAAPATPPPATPQPGALSRPRPGRPPTSGGGTPVHQRSPSQPEVIQPPLCPVVEALSSPGARRWQLFVRLRPDPVGGRYGRPRPPTRPPACERIPCSRCLSFGGRHPSDPNPFSYR